jgi:hypothetical protein
VSSDIDDVVPAPSFVPATVQRNGEGLTPLTAAAIAREEGLIKASILAAMARPRDELRAHTSIMTACGRRGVAEEATYSFPRRSKGKTTQISGPSVQLARLIAQYWGNIRSGIRIVEDTPEARQLCGWAHDVQTNAYTETEHRFLKKFQRENAKTGVTEWIVTDDERELRETTAKWGAFCERNSILKLIPPDVIEDALRVASKTRAEGAKQSLALDRDATCKKLLFVFQEFAVTKDMIDAFLEHDIAQVDERELADLLAIAQSLKDGNSNREEYFRVPKAGSAKEGLDKVAAASTAGTAPAPTPPAEKADDDDEPVTHSLLTELAAAIAAGSASQRQLNKYREEIGLAKRDVMTRGQTREFLRRTKTGELFAGEDDGVPSSPASTQRMNPS